MSVVYLSLGSNLGDRVGYLQQATSLLKALPDLNVISTSSFYESEPWRMNSENWFVNAIIQISTTLAPDELLQECKKIEHILGRKHFSKSVYEDRTIDIDILFYDDLIIKQDDLVVPHPLFHKRADVLVPMLEIAEDFVHPLFNKTVSEIYEDLENPEMVCLYGTRI